MTIAKEIENLINDNAFAQDFLDSFVHDQASAMATGINNAGIKVQLKFLKQHGLSEKTVLSELKEAVDEGK